MAVNQTYRTYAQVEGQIDARGYIKGSDTYTKEEIDAINSSGYRGEAFPTTVPTAEQLASSGKWDTVTAGTYTNMGGLVVSSGDLADGRQIQLLYTYGAVAPWSKVFVGQDLGGYALSEEVSEEIEQTVEQFGYESGLKNLIDKTKIVGGKYYSPGSNAIASGSAWRRTDWIRVEEGVTYIYNTGGDYQNGGYFANYGDTIGVQAINPANRSFTIPKGLGINYVVLNVTNDGQAVTTYDDIAQLEQGFFSTPYSPFQPAVSVRTKNLSVSPMTESEYVKLYSFNGIDPATCNYIQRYSTATKGFTSDSLGIAASNFCAVEEGQSYVLWGEDSIYNGNSSQGGFFTSIGTTALQNISFNPPVTGAGRVFVVPTGLGIKYAVFNLRKLGDDFSQTTLNGIVQLEKGEQATAYQPYTLEKIINPAYIKGASLATPTPSPSGGFNAEAWYKYTEGEERTSMLLDKAPDFFSHWLKKDKDLVVVNTGTSLTARTDEHCTLKSNANERPPLMHSNNMASILWDKMKWENQKYRRYDYPSFFTEVNSGWLTDSALAEWDDNTYRKGLTRYNTNNALTGNMLSFVIPAGAWQFNFVYRTDSLGCEQVELNLAAGKVEVFDESDSSWKEANGFVFSMREATPVSRNISVPNPSTGGSSVINIHSKGNTTYQKRLKMRCKSGVIDSRAETKTITLEKLMTGRFMYWGTEWSNRKYMISYINAARGSHNTQATVAVGLPRFADNEVWSFKPDLMFFELPIHNDGAGSATPYAGQYWERLTENFVFNPTYELSMVKRSTDLNGYVPEIIMFNSSISYNFGAIETDGTLKMVEQTDGIVMTALDKYNQAYNYVLENYPNVGFINSVKRWVDAGNAIWGNLRTATEGSGTGGNTFTNEGSHWNDTGSKIIAKTLTGIFEFV